MNEVESMQRQPGTSGVFVSDETIQVKGNRYETDGL